jgi:probable HAF family extracellular repeat protein
VANCTANAKHDSGIIAGEDRGQGVLYIGSTKQVLPGTDSANGINSSGQVVGDAVGGAFLYSNGQIKSLGPGHAAGISDNGRIVGSNLNLHAAIFANGQSQDLGTLGGVQGQSIAVAVNNAGQIVGQSVVDQDGPFGEIYHPFLYSNGIMQDLGSPGGNGYSSAHAINNSGQIVGMYDIQPSGPFAGVAGKPFVYADGTIHDLASLVTNLPAFSTLTSAGGINDSGQIAGTVMFGDGEFHAVLLTPAEVSAVPLPSACWASLAVLPLLLFARRKIATVSP